MKKEIEKNFSKQKNGNTKKASVKKRRLEI